MNGKCERCAFWKAETSGVRQGMMGECRREAPRLDFAKREVRRGVFPLTAKADWCGRYEDGPSVISI